MDPLENVVAKVVSLSSLESSGMKEKDYSFVKKARQMALEGVTMMEKTASDNSSYTQAPYSTSFLNLSDTQIPRSSLEIFKWCKYFYTFDSLVAGTINALANFPVTEVYFEDTEDFEEENAAHASKKNENISKESDTVKVYKKMFFKKHNIYKLLVEIGIDYFLYGNCFIFGEYTNPTDKRNTEWKSIRRLDPSMVIIDYNPVTQEKIYKWRVPAKILNIVRKKAPLAEYNKIPPMIREAVAKNGAVILNSNNIYHFSRPTDSMGDNSVWGTPVIANVLKLLMYRNTLRQAQEAIAKEHIVPFRVYYLQSTENVNLNVDWSNAADSFASELMKSVRDPNHKVVSPVPVGLLNVGGDGKALLLTPEIEQVQSEILAGMNVPREFIFGGVSYSGSSVSLKILENQFITYRLLMEDFVQNFCIKKLAIARKEWVSEADDDSLVSVRFNDLKMQDDVQQKQLVISLNQAGKVSDTYMLKMMTLEPDKIKSQIQAEARENLKNQFELQKLQAANNFEMQKIQIVYQARLQKYQILVGQLYGVPAAPQQAIDENGVPIEQPMTDGMPAEDPMVAGGAVGATDTTGTTGASIDGQIAQESTPEQSPVTQPNITNIAQMQEAVIKMEQMPEEQQEYYMSLMSEAERQQFMHVKETMDSSSDKTDMRAMPDQKPPRRNTLG